MVAPTIKQRRLAVRSACWCVEISVGDGALDVPRTMFFDLHRRVDEVKNSFVETGGDSLSTVREEKSVCFAYGYISIAV